MHRDAVAAENANSKAAASLETYCELTLPASCVATLGDGGSGERTTYDVTDAVRNGCSDLPGWSVFDAFLKSSEPTSTAVDLPAALQERQVGGNGELHGRSLRLQAVAYVRAGEAKRSARCMEAQQADATTKVDKSRHHYFKIVCSSAEHKTSTTLEAVLLTQRKGNFTFVLDHSMRLFYGTALRRVNAFSTDGDSNLYEVVQSLQGKYGMDFQFVRCRWHGTVKPFLNICTFSNQDGGVALTVLDQVGSWFAACGLWQAVGLRFAVCSL